MAKVLIKKLASSVKLPAYKTNGASGMDLMAFISCLLYTSPSPRDGLLSRMPSSA